MKRILVVDDAEEVRVSLRIALELEGFEVVEATDGLQAINLLDADPFDLLVTDLWMPNVDGVELLKRVRVGRPGLKVIVISGGGTFAPLEFSDALARTWGADAILHKPFAKPELCADVNRLLAS